jgi:transposase-like protein
VKAKDFRALLAELGALTSVQLNALMSALSSRRSAGDVVALIEAEFAKAPACGHCGSDAFNRWGVATGMKRYKCKACDRFNALISTPLAHLQKREKWLEAAIDEARVCGGMVRSNEEWLAHPHGQVLAAKPIVEIIKIAESDPGIAPTMKASHSRCPTSRCLP